jgi:hypothetical protein
MTDTRFVCFDDARRLKQDCAIGFAGRVEDLQPRERKRARLLAQHLFNVDDGNCHSVFLQR